MKKDSKAFLLFFFFFWYFVFLRAAATVYEGSQARGLMGAVVTGLHQSHSNTRSEPCLRLTTAHGNTGDP